MYIVQCGTILAASVTVCRGVLIPEQNRITRVHGAWVDDVMEQVDDLKKRQHTESKGLMLEYIEFLQKTPFFGVLAFQAQVSKHVIQSNPCPNNAP